MTTRVLIADDQALVRDGFRMILEAEGDFEVVAEVADGLEAVLAARETNPDVILMDVRMPKVDGLQATRKLLERNATGARILILTTFDLDEYVYEALRAGASGFLLKDRPPEELVAAVRVVAISAFESPRAIRTRTSRSRSVSSRRSSRGGAGARRANSSMSRRVTDGESSASPLATTRTAATSSSGGRSFRRNPLAPARSAS